MTDAKNEAAGGASASNAGLCAACGGNDGDMPCAYPSEKRHGCLRDRRVATLTFLICPRCKVDRFKAPCPDNSMNCPMRGEAHNIKIQGRS